MKTTVFSLIATSSNISSGYSCDLSTFISIIACAIGCLSFVLSAYALWRERYCIKVEFIKSENFFIEPVTPAIPFPSKTAFVHMIIKNNSCFPITIHDAYIKIGKQYARFERYEGGLNFALPKENTAYPKLWIDQQNFVLIPMDRQLRLPLRLEGRDSFECIAYIRVLPCIGWDSEESVRIAIVLKNAVKDHKFNVKLTKYEA